VAGGNLRDGVVKLLVLPARARHENRAWAVVGADEDVLGAGRQVDEVPRAQRPLLTLDEEEALAVEDEEVLLKRLAVVEAVGLARVEDADVASSTRRS